MIWGLAFVSANLASVWNGVSQRKQAGELAKGQLKANTDPTREQQEHQSRIEKIRRDLQLAANRQNLAIQQENLEFQRWRFQKEKELQAALAAYNRETQIALAACQRETALSLPEVNKLFENWPLTIVPKQILGSHSGNDPIPLRILISPPVINFDCFDNFANSPIPRVESFLCQEIRDFLDQHYAPEDALRPTVFLDGAFESKKYRGGTSVQVLFGMLRSEPILILESEIDGDYLNFRFAYWGLGDTSPMYKTVFSQLEYRESFVKSAQARAKEWKKGYELLKTQGRNPKEFNELDTFNLELYEIEQQLKAIGADVSQLRHRYKISNDDCKDFFKFLAVYHCLVISWITDFYYLNHYEITPILPKLLFNLVKDFNEEEASKELIHKIIISYKELYERLGNSRSHWTPDFLLQVANLYVTSADLDEAKALIRESILSWLKLHKVAPPDISEFQSLVEAMHPLLGVEDKSYVDLLNQLLLQIYEHNYPDLNLIIEQASALRKERAGTPFSFETVTVDRQGNEIRRETYIARSFTETLPQSVSLEMVTIPSGEFMMGSPETEDERSGDEGPQHRVAVQSFLLGKYPITQEQWRVVAALRLVKRHIEADPSHFKGKDRPVEQASWLDAEEFCLRLSEATGRTYRLPSEAEWEYACRAGTQTPFAFGETITSDLANFNGNYTYASAPEGKYRQQTTDVGSFLPNAFGLFDMHGNVWEWCLDHWHDQYNGAPTDGSAWLTKNDNSSRILRGGSWFPYPRWCRSAYRGFNSPDIRYDIMGFRVVCDSPGI